MRSHAVRFLAIACALTLALPPGWCCLFALPSAGKATTCCRGSAEGCCCACAAQRSATSQPGRPPPPAPVRHCPCTDRNTTLPGKAVEKAAVDCAPAAAPVDCDIPLVPTGAAEDFGPPALAPPLPLHVLHCLWLC